MRSRSPVPLLCLVPFSMLAGCLASVPKQPPPSTAPVSQVIDRVKDELTAYAASTPFQAVHGTCYPVKPGSVMNLSPTKVTVTLKAVSLREHDPQVGLVAPLGVLKIDPSYSGAYSSSQTQTLVIPLTVPQMTSGKGGPVGDDHPLAQALASFRDELLKVDHSKTPCLQFKDDAKFKVSVAFDVVNKSTAGFGIQLAIFKVGDKEVISNEAHQTLDIEMVLTGSDGMMLLPPA